MTTAARRSERRGDLLPSAPQILLLATFDYPSMLHQSWSYYQGASTTCHQKLASYWYFED